MLKSRTVGLVIATYVLLVVAFVLWVLDGLEPDPGRYGWVVALAGIGFFICGWAALISALLSRSFLLVAVSLPAVAICLLFVYALTTAAW